MASWFILRLETGQQLDPAENYKDAIAVVKEQPYIGLVAEDPYIAVVADGKYVAVVAGAQHPTASIKPVANPTAVIGIPDHIGAEVDESRNVAVVTIPGKLTAEVD